MALPHDDQKYLTDRGFSHIVTMEGNMTCVVIKQYRLPPGLDRPESDLLIRLNPGYPDVAPDMWWFDPPIRASNGRPFPATECYEQHLGRRWQRWSRHFQPGQWRSGIDSLESFLALIRKELERSALAPAG